MSFSAPNLQEIAKERYGIAGTIYHVSAAGNDSNDGLSWNTAFATPTHAASVAVAGDLILLGSMFTLPDSSTQFKPAAGVHVKGFGPSTGITGSYAGLAPNGMCVIAGTSVWEDFTIDNTSAASGLYAAPLTNALGTHNAILRRIDIKGTTDCFYLAVTSNSLFRFYGCRLFSNWDFVALKSGSANTVELHDCVMVSAGPCPGFVPLPAGALITTGLNVVSSNRAYVYGGSMDVSGNDRQVAAGVDTGTIVLMDVAVNSHGTGSPMVDLLQQNGGTLSVGGSTSYNTARVSGSMTLLPPNSNAKSISEVQRVIYEKQS